MTMTMPPVGPVKRLLLSLALVLVTFGVLCLAFRVRDHDVCTSERCPPTPTAAGPAGTRAGKRGFETASARGSFAKKPPDGDPQHQTVAKKLHPGKLWSKLTKIEDDELLSDEDEIVEIEVEDDSELVEEENGDDEKSDDVEESEQREEEEEEKRKESEEFEKRKRDDERIKREIERQQEEIRKRREREDEERRKREAEVRRKRQEAERLLIEEAERRLKEEQEKQRLEEEEEKKLILEVERKKREEEEELKRRELEEAERIRKEEEEERKREKEAERIRQEEERKRLEEAEKKRKEEERKKKELEEAEKKKREEERKKREFEEAEKKRKEEERKKKELEEAEKKKKEEERKKKELEEAEKKRKEEERKKKELEEAQKKKKEEDDAENEDEDEYSDDDVGIRKRIPDDDEDENEDEEKEEDEDVEKKKDAEEDKKRIERVKKEAEERSKKKMPEKDDGSDESEDDDENEADEAPIEEKDDDENEADEAPIEEKDDDDDDDDDDDEEEEDDDQEPAEELDLSQEKLATESSKSKKKKAEEFGVPPSLAELNDMILSVPTFVPNFTAVENPECQRQGEIFLRQLRGFKLWALQMLDSSAKIPSGLLRGNINQLGDFDQCLDVSARVVLDEATTLKLHGKYCLAQVDLHPVRPDAQLPVNLIQSRALIRGNLSDPGHFVPKFTTANWALCLPAACTAEDARVAVEDALNPYNESIGIRFAVNVDPDMCYVKPTSPSYSKETVAVLYFYAMFVCLSLVATIRDLIMKPQEKGSYSERIIMSFSLKRTVKSLFGRSEHDDIGCIHGIRSLATVALYIAHKLIPVSSLPYANRATLTETAANPLSLILRASLFYTDSFLLLSGVLTSYNMAKELSDRGEVRWFCRFVARYIRLTPALLAVVLWYAYVMEHIGSGPQWNAVVKRNADICKQSSWINLFYVQNHLPFEEMCATHTHQLALDMQLSLIAPVVVFFLQMKPLLGVILVFFLLQVSATLRYFATSSNNLSLIIFHGMTIKELYKTANLTYTSPVHRATPYLFGVCLGVILRHTGKNVKLYKIFALLGWLIAGGLGMWSLFSPWHLARRDYEYDVEEATHYAVISPILTALSLCWTIFACFTDNGGIINRILSSHWMVVFSKLSYSIYLTQFAVFFYNVGSVRYSSEFQILKILDPIEAVIVVVVSVVLTLIFDIPMQEAKNIVMESSDSLAVEDKIKTVMKETIVPEPSPIVSEKRNNLKKQPLRRSSTADISMDDYDDEEEEESETGNWNWNRGTFTKSEPREFLENGYDEPYRNPRYRRLDRRRMTMVRTEAYDDWDYRGGSRRTSRSEEHSMDEDGSGRNGHRYSNAGLEDDRGSRNGYRYSNAGLEDDRGSRNGYRYSNAGLEDDRGIRNGYRYSNSALDDEGYRQPRERYYSGGYTRSPMRDLDAPVLRRSMSREKYAAKEPETERSFREYRRPLITISKEEDYQNSRSPRSSMPRFSEVQRSISSEGDPDLRRGNFRRGSSAEPRIASDEDEWEEEIKLRRSRFERVSSQERDRVPPAVAEEEDEWNTLRRRSSAEGKIALLKEPIRPNMELWTVSKIQLGSSQEPDDEEFDENVYSSQRREYRDQESPLPEEVEEEEDTREENHKNALGTTSLPTSFEEEEEVNGYDFGLKRDSKMITIQDLSRLSQVEDDMAEEKEWNKLDVKTGLFKRESIIKSQASEEDPEYLIPERPKLVEQEQEHPFKKAWQLQKSRSEEEGPAGFAVKDVKSTVTTLEKQKEEPEEKRREEESHEGAQSYTPDVSCDITFVWQARSQETEDAKSYSNTETSSASSRQDYLDDDEIYNDFENRRKSDEENWTWTERDT